MNSKMICLLLVLACSWEIGSRVYLILAMPRDSYLTWQYSERLIFAGAGYLSLRSCSRPCCFHILIPEAWTPPQPARCDRNCGARQLHQLGCAATPMLMQSHTVKLKTAIYDTSKNISRSCQSYHKGKAKSLAGVTLPDFHLATYSEYSLGLRLKTEIQVVPRDAEKLSGCPALPSTFEPQL